MRVYISTESSNIHSSVIYAGKKRLSKFCTCEAHIAHLNYIPEENVMSKTTRHLCETGKG